MNFRRVISLVGVISFVTMVLTSLVLYIVPEGRIAQWANWSLWGMSKEDWGALHTTLGTLWLIALVFHIYYNWKPIKSYLKGKAKTVKIFTKEFNIALIVTIVVCVGTLAEWPPFSSFLNLGHSFKEKAAVTYGEPPYGHAEQSSLRILAKRMDIDLPKAMSMLKQAGLVVTDDKQTLTQIAKANKVSPQTVYLAVKPAESQSELAPGEIAVMPDAEPSGTGKKLIKEVLDMYNLKAEAVMPALADKGLKAQLDQTFKQVADANGMAPSDVYLTIREVAIAKGLARGSKSDGAAKTPASAAAAAPAPAQPTPDPAPVPVATPAPAAPAATGKPAPMPETEPTGLGRMLFTDVMTTYGLDKQIILKGLSEKGLKAQEGQTFREIADANGKAPNEIFQAVREVALTSPKAPEPAPAASGHTDEGTPSGLGRMTLAEASKHAGVTPDAAMAKLKAKGVEAKADDTMRAIADTKSVTPADVYGMIKN